MTPLGGQSWFGNAARAKRGGVGRGWKGTLTDMISILRGNLDYSGSGLVRPPFQVPSLN